MVYKISCRRHGSSARRPPRGRKETELYSCTTWHPKRSPCAQSYVPHWLSSLHVSNTSAASAQALSKRSPPCGEADRKDQAMHEANDLSQPRASNRYTTRPSTSASRPPSPKSGPPPPSPWLQNFRAPNFFFHNPHQALCQATRACV